MPKLKKPSAATLAVTLDPVDSSATHVPPTGQRLPPAVPPTAPVDALQVFANPQPARDYAIRFRIPEFTCLCPLTGQPDFAHFTIDMVADQWCVELKSLKLYLWHFRDRGAFHEKVTNDIVDEIVRATQPRYVRLAARWNVRGGIYTNVVAEHRKRGWKPPLLVALPGLAVADDGAPGALD